MSSADTTRTTGKRISYVAIEGCIGVGKTTLTNAIASRLSARTVLEEFEDNPFLADFYKDKQAHAFKTQLFFLLSRFNQQDAIAQSDLFEQAVVADYLFSKDRIFAELTLQGSEMKLYDQVFSALHERTTHPDLVIFLRAPLDLILERIKHRGRDYEKDMDVAYLEALVDAYQRFFSNYTHAPVLTVDTTELNFPEREQDTDLVLAAAKRVVENGERRYILTGPPRQPRLL